MKETIFSRNKNFLKMFFYCVL